MIKYERQIPISMTLTMLSKIVPEQAIREHLIEQFVKRAFYAPKSIVAILFSQRLQDFIPDNEVARLTTFSTFDEMRKGLLAFSQERTSDEHRQFEELQDI